jgi:hypothetical protein
MRYSPSSRGKKIKLGKSLQKVSVFWRGRLFWICAFIYRGRIVVRASFKDPWKLSPLKIYMYFRARALKISLQTVLITENSSPNED